LIDTVCGQIDEPATSWSLAVNWSCVYKLNMKNAAQKSSWGRDISTPAGRRWAWLHLFLRDHHILRQRWWNLHEIAQGVWRSNQPSPSRLTKYKALGIKTVVSLRGNLDVSYNLFEREACTSLELDFLCINGLTARNLQPAAKILEVMDAIADLPRPLVMHCKSGADRSGFAAALYLIFVESRPVAEAAAQLAPKYVHFPRSKAGVLDHVFRVYLRDAEPQGQEFRAWLENAYDPALTEADFKDWREARGRWAK
jgi:protein tyrosine/serine phosphatase